MLAVIQTESSFNPDMVGGVGEVGLMQLRPETAEWLVKKERLRVSQKPLVDPIKNIQIGAAYMSYLRERFDDHARLYVAAYNMGPRNVRELRQKDIWPKEYAARVMSYYVDFYAQLRQQMATRSNAKQDRMLLTENEPQS